MQNGVITTVAGTGTAGFGGDGGPASSALLNRPETVAVDGNGVVYIGDRSNERVRMLAPGEELSSRTLSSGLLPAAP